MSETATDIDRNKLAELVAEPGLRLCLVGYNGGSIMPFSQELRDAIVAALRASPMSEVATWMSKNGLATGHGDSIDDMLDEAKWQLIQRSRASPAPAQGELVEQVVQAIHAARYADPDHPRKPEPLTDRSDREYPTRLARAVLALPALSPSDREKQLREALERAAEAIKDWDGGDPQNHTGWKSDELLAAWLDIRAAIEAARRM